MDVADFLKLKRAFKCSRIVISATEIDEIVRVSEYLGKVGYLTAEFQDLLELFRQREQALCHFIVILLADSPLPFRDSQCHHGHNRHLAGKGLGGRDADLRTDMHVSAAVRRTGYAGTDHVAYTIDEGACFARK